MELKNSLTAIHNHHYPIYTGDVKVKEGGKFSVTCTVHKSPITWYKDEEPMESQDLFYSHKNGSAYWSTLTISGAKVRHSGKYQCTLDFPTSHYVNVERGEDLQVEENNILGMLTTEKPIKQIVTKIELPTFVPDYDQKLSQSYSETSDDDEDLFDRKNGELRRLNENSKEPTTSSISDSESESIKRFDDDRSSYMTNAESPANFDHISELSETNGDDYDRNSKHTVSDYEDKDEIDEYYEAILTTMVSVNLSTRAVTMSSYIPIEIMTNEPKFVATTSPPLSMTTLESFMTTTQSSTTSTTMTSTSTTASEATTADEFTYTPLPIESKGSE